MLTHQLWSSPEKVWDLRELKTIIHCEVLLYKAERTFHVTHEVESGTRGREQELWTWLMSALGLFRALPSTQPRAKIVAPEGGLRYGSGGQGQFLTLKTFN